MFRIICSSVLVLPLAFTIATGTPRYTQSPLPEHSFTYQHTIKNNLPDDISFCIVDLKYDGTRIAVCELGEGLESQFKGYDHFFGPGKLWSHFWQFLHTLNVPLWYCGKHVRQHSYVEYALKTLTQLGGRLASNMTYLEKDSTFQKTAHRTKSQQPGIKQYNGIVALRSLGRPSGQLNNFFKKYPNMLVIGRATNEFVRNKQKTSELFDACDVAAYRPKHLLMQKKYYPELTQKIIQKLGCDYFVIKPINSSVGRGIIMVEKADLDRTLKLILTQQSVIKTTKSLQTDPSYYHWANDKNEYLLIEELVASKSLVVNERPYNPTMRVVYALVNNNGKLSITFFDAYWKLPLKALDEGGSLTEQHKSKIATSHESSVLVSPEDFVTVTAQLCKFLPPLYTKMLELSDTRATDTFGNINLKNQIPVAHNSSKQNWK